MTPTNFHMALGKWALAILPLVLTPGCATPRATGEQDASLAARMATLEAQMDTGTRQASAHAGEARQQTLSTQARQAEQAARIADLEGRLNAQAQSLAAMQRQIAEQTDEGKAAEAQMSRQLAQQLAQSEARVAATAQAHAEQRIKDANAALADRMARMEGRLNEVARMAEDALAAMGLGPRKILGKVVHSVTLTDDKTLFPINSPDLGEKDLAKLNAVADFVKNLDVNYHLAIHGHTDGLGSDDYNYALGKARAEVVKSYLHEKRGIPLLRMSVISHGALDVSAYREGANRRIVVEVLQ